MKIDITIRELAKLHSMLSKKIADSDLRALMISLFMPKQITVPGYMDQIEQFLERLE
ncbi:hypothetical protein [Paenibacillus harenae]|uniref:Uncharacterized protein n=1 Tax=Paenibacillus harenae TaxID=306543 RepID=A0ABT9U444_PAEHA|nr:hypothetical protein [Paenibacillus harenae]MDQ0113219.1 hypothetical protein [Paenibacillus harenae]